MTAASINGEKSRRLALAARQAIEQIGSRLDLDLWIRLWDGSRVPLGRNVTGDLTLSISSPGVISSILRRPTLDRVLRHYLHGQIDFEGGTLIDLGNLVAFRQTRSQLKQLDKWHLFKCILPFLLAKADKPKRGRGYGKGEVGGDRAGRDEKSYNQFHYDVGNAFYQLFLDQRMMYTCAYFRDRSNSLDQAQRDKLEMICRKLRLQPGERFLDIGCGWGGLVCYAAENFGVEAHGVTLSRQQSDYAQAEIERRGLTSRVRVELKDYQDLTGQFDKIASIGMYEGIGVANYEAYFKKICQLLDDRGIFLNHGITRRAKRKIENFGKISPGKRVILKYIFPGSELDHIGHTLQVMESCGFEVHDVEGLRLHYARTLRLWHDRLAARREEAIELVGPELYRIWIAYLAGVTGGFAHGPSHVFQTVAVKRADKAASPLPPTRDDLYRAATPQRHDRDATPAASD